MQKLVEKIDFSGADFIEENGVKKIRNAVLLGSESRNGYGYSLEAMREAAQNGLYTNVRVFVNHSDGARDLMSLGGMVESARFEDNRIKGDVKLLPDQFGEKIWTVAQSMPTCGGFSHVADGQVETQNGRRVVTKITKIYSVDAVVNPATTTGFFEGRVTEGDIPKPGPTERQIDFVPRCMALVQHQNPTIGTDQALAICFTSWQARYETGGQTDESPLPVAPAPKTESTTETITTGDEPNKERNHMDSHNNIDILDQIETQANRAGRIAMVTHPLAQSIVREAMDKDREEQAQQRRHARLDHRVVEQIAGDAVRPLTTAELQEAAVQRIQEKRRLNETNHRRAAEIAEEVAELTTGLTEC